MEEAVLAAIKSLNRGQWINAAVNIICCIIWAALALFIIPRVVHNSIDAAFNNYSITPNYETQGN